MDLSGKNVLVLGAANSGVAAAGGEWCCRPETQTRKNDAVAGKMNMLSEQN